MAGRVVANWAITVDKPAEEVFAYLADVRRHAEWSPKPYRVEGLPDGQVGVGTRFTSYGWVPGDAEHRNEVEITELDPPTRMAWVSEDRGERFVNEFTLTAQGGATRVDRRMDMPKPSGVTGLVFPLVLAAVVKPGVQKGLKTLKANVERGTTR